MGEVIDPLEPIETDEADRINRAVYCHHCKRMATHKLLGRDSWGTVVLQCPGVTCGGIVRLVPARVVPLTAPTPWRRV